MGFSLWCSNLSLNFRYYGPGPGPGNLSHVLGFPYKRAVVRSVLQPVYAMAYVLR